METEQAKIYHHHTPRRYLLPWADADERIAWYGYGKVDRSGLTVVGGENDFYKLKELTVPDIDCLKLFIDGLREIGRDVSCIPAVRNADMSLAPGCKCTFLLLLRSESL
jgi:hypothetical protein